MSSKTDKQEVFVVLAANMGDADVFNSAATIAADDQQIAYEIIEEGRDSNDEQTWVIDVRQAEFLRRLLDVAIAQAGKRHKRDEIKFIPTLPKQRDATFVCDKCGAMHLLGATVLPRAKTVNPNNTNCTKYINTGNIPLRKDKARRRKATDKGEQNE